MLRKEFEYFLKHRKALVARYHGKYVVIKDGRVLGAYSSELEAVRKTSVTVEMGTFLVQKCARGDSSFTQTFHSRVSFK